MPVPVPLSDATAVMLADGWHAIATGTQLGFVINPSFIDPTTGGVVTPSDNWVEFTEAATGKVYACPIRSVVAVQLTAPVTQQ